MGGEENKLVFQLGIITGQVRHYIRRRYCARVKNGFDSELGVEQKVRQWLAFSVEGTQFLECVTASPKHRIDVFSSDQRGWASFPLVTHSRQRKLQASL